MRNIIYILASLALFFSNSSYSHETEDKELISPTELALKSDTFKIESQYTGHITDLKMRTELFVQNLNLEDLSRFFEPNAGVKLKGTLVSGKSVSHLNGIKLIQPVLEEW